MLYVFCGDRFSSRERAREFVAVCRKKRERAEYIRLSAGVPQQSMEELLMGQGLFETKYIIFCDEVLADSAVSDHLVQNPEPYQTSPHMFVIFEPSLSPAHEKLFTEHGATVQRFAEQSKKEDTQSLFAFTDVFMGRNRERTFITLHRLLSQGESSSSLLNILLWQLRMLALVSVSHDAVDAGVKPFVYTKTKKALTAFSDPVETLTRAEEILRNGRLKGENDDEILEYLVLTIG